MIDLDFFDNAAHTLMDFAPVPNCNGSTVIDEYIVFYHEDRLYSVRNTKTNVISLVYAKNPYDACNTIKNCL